MDDKVKFALKFIEKQAKKYENIGTVNSFGKDSIVMQDLVMQVLPDIKTLWIKPPFLPEDTVEYAEKMIDQYNINIRILTVERGDEWMEKVVIKPKLWLKNPELCCQVFKVKPAMDGVKEHGLDAWFSGMRKTESEKRGMYTYEWSQGSFMKLHPILDFTEADIWRYIACNNLRPHPWYALGYRSLGCEPCSFPNTPESERGGRWKNTLMEGGDCGIHCTSMKE